MWPSGRNLPAGVRPRNVHLQYKDDRPRLAGRCLEYARFQTFSIFLSSNQTRLTDTHHPPCQTPGMDLSKMNHQEIEALLRLRRPPQFE